MAMAKPKRIDVEERVARFGELCRNAGLRLTHQRIEIFRELAVAIDHPSAEQLYQRVVGRMPTISLDTVYRTLATLEEHRVIYRVGVISGRARFEANQAPHHHVLCTQCGMIADVYADSHNHHRLAELLPRGFQLESVRVELRGLCAACLSKRNRPS